MKKKKKQTTWDMSRRVTTNLDINHLDSCFQPTLLLFSHMMFRKNGGRENKSNQMRSGTTRKNSTKNILKRKQLHTHKK